jgi:hypothetical protein
MMDLWSEAELALTSQRSWCHCGLDKTLDRSKEGWGGRPECHIGTGQSPLSARNPHIPLSSGQILRTCRVNFRRSLPNFVNNVRKLQLIEETITPSPYPSLG